MWIIWWWQRGWLSPLIALKGEMRKGEKGNEVENKLRVLRHRE